MISATAEAVAAITAGATLAGAGGLAFVTLHTTSRRFQEAREHQQRELSAEAKRNSAQLAHERELADLDHLRSLLDDGAISLDRARAACKAVHHQLLRMERVDLDKVSPAMHPARLALAALRPDLVNSVLSVSARLEVRLGPDPLSGSFRNAAEILRRIAFELSVIREGGAADCERRRRRMEDDIRDFSDAISDFVAIAVRRAGTLNAA